MLVAFHLPWKSQRPSVSSENGSIMYGSESSLSTIILPPCQ